jgi:hypothetical protein
MPSVVTKPLHIDFVITPYLGKLAMSACPGLSFGQNTYRSTLEDDVSTIHRLGILTVISLMETQELKRVGAKSISHYLGRRNIAWHQLQVSQSGTPNISTIHQWRRMAKPLINTLATGGNVLIDSLLRGQRPNWRHDCMLTQDSRHEWRDSYCPCKARTSGRFSNCLARGIRAFIQAPNTHWLIQ